MIPSAKEVTPEFRFKDVDASDTPNTVGKVAKLDAYLVSYRDGQNKEQVRVCLKMAGADVTFLIQPKVSGTNIITPAHNWFHHSLAEKLKESSFEARKPGETVESV